MDRRRQLIEAILRPSAPKPGDAMTTAPVATPMPPVDHPLIGILAQMLATPKGMDVAQDFNTAAQTGSDAVEHVARTGERAFDLVNRAGGDPRNMDPRELGQTALEVGSMPLMGAAGGVPTNAAGQVVALEKGNPIKLGVMGAAAGAGGTAAYDWSQGDLDKLDWDYIMDRAGPNAGYGAMLGFGTGVVGEMLDEADWARRQFKQTPVRRDIPASAMPSTPRRPSSPGGPRPQTSAPVSSAPPPQSAPAGRPTPPPSAPVTSPPSGAPTGSQSIGNQASSGTSVSPSEYGPEHTKAARVYLENLFSPANPRGRTPEQMAGDLQPYFRGSGLDTPPDTRARAAKTMEILKGLLPRDLSSTDPATVMRAIGQATGKPGTLAVAGMAGAGAAAEDDPQRAMLVDLIRRVQAGEI